MANEHESPQTEPTQTTHRPLRKRRLLVWFLLVGVIALGVSAFVLQLRSPAGNASGDGLITENFQLTARTLRTVKLGTFNIHGGKGKSNSLDLDATAGVLKGLDFVGLNEVHGAMPWDDADQACLLGRKMNMPYLFAPFERRYARDYFGNGVLSSVPVGRWERSQLHVDGYKDERNVVSLVLKTTRPITILVTHVGRRADHANQLELVLDQFVKTPPPVVIMGDFNAPRGEAPLAKALARSDVKDPVAELGKPDDAKRVDWILTRGLRAVDAGIVRNDASDHPMVWAELQVDGAAATSAPTTSAPAAP